MEKRAILTRGGPLPKDNKEHFNSSCDRDLRIMEQVAGAEGYSVEQTSLDEVMGSNGDGNYDADVLLYYTGHANGRAMEREGFKIQEVLDVLRKFKGEKIFVIDGCAAEEGFEKYNFPERSKVISADFVYPGTSIAKLLYDEVIARGDSLSDLTQETFNERKHNWVYVKDTD